MSPVWSQTVDVFPISSAAFGIHPDWFTEFLPRITPAALLLMVLLLVISIGVMALKRFEDAQIENKAWNLPVIITAVLFWPALVIGLKDLVDAFNTFLVREIFRIPWQGFGFPDLSSPTAIVGWSAEGLARFLPNVAYWIIYSFYVIFFFFFAVLGPFVLAKGILMDEVETFLELVKELTVLYLWQTTMVILVVFILPDVVSGQAYPPHPPENFYFLSFLLALLILFVPSITRKFGNHLGGTFFPAGFKLGGSIFGLAVLGRIGGGLVSAAGAQSQAVNVYWEHARQRLFSTGEYVARSIDHRKIQDLEHKNQDLHKVMKTRETRARREANRLDSEFLNEARRAKAELSPQGGQRAF